MLLFFVNFTSFTTMYRIATEVVSRKDYFLCSVHIVSNNLCFLCVFCFNLNLFA